MNDANEATSPAPVLSTLRGYLAKTDGELVSTGERHAQERADLAARQKKETEALETRRTHLMALIQEFEASAEGASSKAPARPSVSIPDFLIGQLRQHGPMTKEELRDRAVEAGYFGPDDVPGRSIHFTVVNLSKSGRIRERIGGKYAVAEQ